MTMTRPGLSILAALVLAAPLFAQTGTVEASLPTTPDPDRHYLLYLHGRIIETQGRRPTHPEFGVYEYDSILQTFADSGLTVISEARPPETAISSYAAKIVADVRTLLEAGVPQGHISVVGFSKGGIIAIAVSSQLQEPGLRFVLLAACSEFVFNTPEYEVSGRVLSVYEASDEFGVSCEPLFVRSSAASESEVEINTGLRHGAFYAPRSEWVGFVTAWSQGRN
jgi:hypothetical protein